MITGGSRSTFEPRILIGFSIGSFGVGGSGRRTGSGVMTFGVGAFSEIELSVVRTGLGFSVRSIGPARTGGAI